MLVSARDFSLATQCQGVGMMGTLLSRTCGYISRPLTVDLVKGKLWKGICILKGPGIAQTV